VPPGTPVSTHDVELTVPEQPDPIDWSMPPVV
jgi:hypothetical protein